jgi:hypothetical protein
MLLRQYGPEDPRRDAKHKMNKLPAKKQEFWDFVSVKLADYHKRYATADEWHE